MFSVLQILTTMLVALAMVPSVAHALELPGKLRLRKEAYFAVQPIYYPGFTMAGMSEPLAIIAAVVLWILTPSGTTANWLTLVALLALIGMQAVYWLFTHPVNNFWLQSEKLGSVGSGFFSLGANRKGDDKADNKADERAADWTELRDRWEYSHVARAALASLSFICLLIAVRYSVVS